MSGPLVYNEIGMKFASIVNGSLMANNCYTKSRYAFGVLYLELKFYRFKGKIALEEFNAIIIIVRLLY